MDKETIEDNLRDYIWAEWEEDSTVLEKDKETYKEELNRELHKHDTELHTALYKECTEVHHRDCYCAVLRENQRNQHLTMI